MKIEKAIENKKNGLWYGNRLILPFTAHILKIVFDDKILTDFSMNSDDVQIDNEEDHISVWFLSTDDLSSIISKWENIKIIAVNTGEDLFDLNNHRKLSIKIQEKHNVEINYTDDDILFIE